MKFEYPSIQSADFQGKRWYDVDGDNVFPSITTVLGRTMPVEKQNKLQAWTKAIGELNAKHHTEKAILRGENVHLMIEHHLMGIPINVPNASYNDKLMFQSLKLPLRKINEVWGQECALYSHVLGVAGRTDCIGLYDQAPSIIDFKTSGRIKNDKDIEDYWLQCTFYALAHNEMFGTDIQQGVIIMGVENSMPMVWKKQLYEFIEPLALRIDEFYAKLTA
jgi:hypothetical protein